jgi:hypothetical protein
MVFEVSNPKHVLKEIKKLKPLKYNRFFWWRRFASYNQPLPKKSSFLDKIKNGDFDPSHYYWQAKYSELEINEKFEECKQDYQDLLMKYPVILTRRKKLWEDFEKDESTKLQDIKKYFLKEFEINSEEYEDEIGEFDGTLEEFYYYIRKTYETR